VSEPLPPLAWRVVAAPMVLLAALLVATSNRYGFHRDELYFRMLHPAWGYVDQPPLTPLLARLAGTLGDSPWQLRLPAVVAAVASVLVLVLVTRELGGGRAAQLLCAWGYAFAATPLAFGHLLLTTSVDLVAWPLVCLFVIRALHRPDGARWWGWTGVAVGLATYNKLLIALLVLALLVGLLLVGPRRVLWSRPVLLGAVAAFVLALPNLLYQATHSWPQLTMARALSEHNAGDVRTQVLPYLVLLLGPPLVPIWIAGLVALWRRPEWRPVRLLVPAFAVVIAETFVGGGQVYYPTGLLIVVFAAGCVPAAQFLARSRPWRIAAVVGIVVNAAVSAVIGLPLLPLSTIGSTPVAGINQSVGDTVGWPRYVQQIANVYEAVPAADRVRTVIIASNYGEAGAIYRYGGRYNLPRPYSAQNQLYFDARPPEGTTTVVAVGGELSQLREHFASCTQRATLENGVDVDNEEQGEPVAVCTGPREPWPTLWRALQHYD
jgi:4-amino-4-deoxy-L-arabinose transferase-like glycosyltransferase